MEFHIGKDILKPVYYERRKSWYISRNDRETLYDENNVWIEFETKEEAEMYLIDMWPGSRGTLKFGGEK